MIALALTSTIWKILIKFPNNNFLISCLDYRDQFKMNVLARKFQNLKIVGFWWFNNNESVIENLLKQRFELLGIVSSYNIQMQE